MKKVLSSALLVSSLAFAGVCKDVVEIMASDLTNVNKSEYKIYSEVTDTDELANINLCMIKNFKVDAFTCKKPIFYTLTSVADSADILILQNGISSEKVVVCMNKTDNCDIVGKNVDKESLKAKGFVPDPTK